MTRKKAAGAHPDDDRIAASADSAGDRSRARSGKGQLGAEIGGRMRIEALLDRFGDVRYVGKNGKGPEPDATTLSNSIDWYGLSSA